MKSSDDPTTGGAKSSVEPPAASPRASDGVRGHRSSAASEASEQRTGPRISIEAFRALELRVGTIRAAEPHPNADRLLVLRVDLGSEERQIVAGIRAHYDAAALVGRQVVVVANLEPARLRGVESQGMVLAATASVSPVRICRAASLSSASAKVPSSATFMFCFTCHQATRGPAATDHRRRHVGDARRRALGAARPERSGQDDAAARLRTPPPPERGPAHALRHRRAERAAGAAASAGIPRARELLLPGSQRRRESRLPRPPLRRRGGARADRYAAGVGGPRGGRAAPGTVLLAWHEPAAGTRPRAPPRARPPPAGRALQRARSSSR